MVGSAALSFFSLFAVSVSAPAGAASGECEFNEGVAFESPTNGDTWAHQMSVTSAGECCARCRAISQCFVGAHSDDTTEFLDH